MADLKQWTINEPYLQLDCGLGEAPFYESATHTLRFVDIVKQKLHFVDLNKGPQSHKVLADLEHAIGTTADIEGSNDEFIAGAKHGFGIYNRKSGGFRYIKRVWDERDGDVASKEERMRFNDGAVDSRGRYWAGQMNDPKVKKPTDEGVLFRLDPDLTLHRMIKKVSIPNGIGWSADDKTMYFTDSPSGNIYAYDFDAESGSISNRRVFFHAEDGIEPDGFAIDEHGYIWTAQFGGGKVLRVSPDGKVVGQVNVPTRCPTCPGFVGDELFITSAAEEEPDKYPNSVRYAGSLFRVKVGVKGQKPHSFKYQASR
ncbi:hypothetical protein L228DRAFT_235308 [Xylona heveae TC161]|uniref:SMP-30/Gluconolactonase/LRE-like region domain-containing protein n=1 Tax=Xylona heveae (strain CBS 132557 / TC161) TaxID=1328760 RepID=A0A165JGI0_XYLHT|nr:hypothetical protein L228DRAFT_235308 [Xylona heveae TC161]KZF26206.1 hypothetical protein L228DRAFT_235308 [Xylona heveae TC161]